MLSSIEKPDNTSRLQSIDIVRGLIMVIMALDHVRDFFSYTTVRPTDVTQASVALFFTRWITHLCAPTFIFLSGVSIYLYFNKVGSVGKTSLFLITRGLWLIVVEIFVISFILTQGYDMTLLEVIWAIGCSMILLAALIRLPRWAQVTIALSMIMLHNAVPMVGGNVPPGMMLFALLHNFPFFIASPATLVAYTIIPWAGVMLLGFAIGPWFGYPQPSRDSLLLKSGIGALLLFVVLRFTNLYGDPFLWSVQERGAVYTFLSFINITKNPPSLLFLSVTLGITCLLLVLSGRFSQSVKDFFAVYGRVPFFYFIVHLAVISVAAYLWTYLSFGQAVNLSFTSPKDWPAEYSANLWRAYAIWIVLVAVLYFPCRWYGAYKAKNKSWWISYL